LHTHSEHCAMYILSKYLPKRPEAQNQHFRKFSESDLLLVHIVNEVKWV
jgi:hypothetical protein